MELGSVDDGERWTGVLIDGATVAHKTLRDVEFADCEFRLTSSDVPWTPVECVFDRCRFVGTDLSLSKWTDCTIRDTSFQDCRLTGADFSTARWTAYSSTSPNTFDRCDLSYANFARSRLGAIRVSECRALEAEFMEADLTGAIFHDTDLGRAGFARSTLANANFLTAFGFVIDPTTAKLRGARFSASSLAGLVIGFGIEID
jgi:fluoroquinolone resistance protein